MLKKENRIYLWVIVTLCGLISGSIGLTSNSVGIFYATVSKDLGVLTGTFIMHNTLACIMLAVVAMFVPKWINRKNFRKVIMAGVLLCGLSAAGMSLADNMTMFYILGLLRGTGTAFFAFVIVSILINHWFTKNHGFITSIIFAFSGVAGAIFSPFLSGIIENYGWRNGYLAMGVMIVLCCLPFAFSKFTLYPEDMGLVPYGGYDTKETKKGENQKVDILLFVYIAIFSSFVHLASAMMQHISSLVTFKGYALSISAFAVSCSMVGNILTKFISGAISDAKGAAFANTSMLLCTIAAAFVLLAGGGIGVISVGSFFYGAVYAETAVGLTLIATELFGKEAYDSVYPRFALVGNASFAIGGALFGYIFDATQTYNYCLIVAIILLLICQLMIILGSKRAKKI